MKDDLIERLRDFGDNAEFEPHMYHVAADRIEAQAAEIARLRACVEALEVEIAAARLFGGGYFGDVVKESTREVHRGLARAQMGKVTANDD